MYRISRKTHGRQKEVNCCSADSLTVFGNNLMWLIKPNMLDEWLSGAAFQMNLRTNISYRIPPK